MTRRYGFSLVDVFTDRMFGGNPLAVFTRPDGLSVSKMQLIARELHCPETTFVLPPETREADYSVRIFTPRTELPMAGSPTIGTAYIISQGGAQRTNLRFEEEVGIIPVSVSFEKGIPMWVTMAQPLPKFGPIFKDKEKIAKLLSLDEDAITPNLPVEAVSCGVPFLYVGLRDLSSAKKIRFRLDVWDDILRGKPYENVFVFTREVENEESFVHARMFAPGLGIDEDPATGAASGPLGCYLVRNRVLRPSPNVEFISEQGIEMGRPSKIKVSIGLDPSGQIAKVIVGGECRKVGEGFLEL